MTMNYSHLSIQQRKELLLSHLKTGQQASCTWETAKSGITTRSIRLWAEQALASRDRRIVQPPANKKEDVLMVVDMDKYRDSSIQYPWATISLGKLKSFSAGGKKYEF